MPTLFIVAFVWLLLGKAYKSNQSCSSHIVSTKHVKTVEYTVIRISWL